MNNYLETAQKTNLFKMWHRYKNIEDLSLIQCNISLMLVGKEEI